MCNTVHIMLNPVEKFKVAILHLNRDWNHRFYYRRQKDCNPTNMVICCTQKKTKKNVTLYQVDILRGYFIFTLEQVVKEP